MPPRIPPFERNVCGAVRRPKRCRHVRAGWLLASLLPLLFPPRSQSQLAANGFTVTNAEFRIYAPGTFDEIAVCRVEKVFTSHRKLGFFYVQVLPILVVQGVKLELVDRTNSGAWTETFRPGWLPEHQNSAIEWRDLSVSVRRENPPVLRAARAQLAAGGGKVCTLENVTMAAAGQTWHAARAELRDEAGRPRVVWRADGGEQRWDLLTGKIISNNQELAEITKGTK